MLTRHGIRDSVTARVAWALFLYATVHPEATFHFASRGRSAGSTSMQSLLSRQPESAIWEGRQCTSTCFEAIFCASILAGTLLSLKFLLMIMR